MSHAPQASTARRDSATDEVEVIETEQTAQAVLDALDDPDCRAILDAISEETLTASELSETCDLPLSTAYRKIDILTEAGLIEERTRIRSSGSHTSEYARLVEGVQVTMSESGLSLAVSKREAQTPAPRFSPACSG